MGDNTTIMSKVEFPGVPGNVLTQSWSGKSAVFFMESALTFHGSSKSNKKPSDGGGISD
jgi:hypothetical protein